MASIKTHRGESINSNNSHFSKVKAMVETQFYRNNVKPVTSIKEAYSLAASNPNTIITDLPIKHSKELGFDKNSKVLVENNGSKTGRNAKARKIFGINDSDLTPIILDSLNHNPQRTFYTASAVVGLDSEFMMQAHICINEGQENNLLSWLLNFQIMNDEYKNIYHQSQKIDENDIFVYVDSDWKHSDYPSGISYFDPKRNVVCILGMTYFGELKKGTLTLAWASAFRNGYVACHGGLKSFKYNDSSYVASFFGLSGSGKSTLTHAKHDNKYEIKVLHDDAFIINLSTGSSIALEPAYFDKTNDYPHGHPEQDYFLTVQNVGVTKDEYNHKVLVTQDIRNGNGRTVKSRFSTPNRVDKIQEPINSIFWIMKDDSLPPLLKINNPILATTFGLTLATKRSSAEIGVVDNSALVIEPYANPFRVYNLNDDYSQFKKLFDSGVQCYIINTGYYLDSKISKETTLSLIEGVVENNLVHSPFFGSHDIENLSLISQHDVIYTNETLDLFKERIQLRINFIQNYNLEHPHDHLDTESIQSLENLMSSLSV